MFEYDKELEYMPPLAASSHAKASGFSSIILFAILGFFVTFIWWSSNYQIDQVARGEAKIVPSKQIQTLSHLEGGVLKSLLVQEGDRVKKGQILAKIDNTQAKNRFNSDMESYNQLYCDTLKLTALIKEDKDLLLPEKLRLNHPNVTQQTISDFKAESQKLSNEKEIVLRRIEQKKQESIDFVQQLKALEKQYELLQQELQLNEKMLIDGIVAKVEVLKLQREVSDFRSKLDSTRLNIKKAEQGSKQENDELEQVDFGAKSRWRKELSMAKAKLNEAKQSFTMQLNKIKRTEVRAPVSGTIKTIYSNTIGGTIRAADKIMEIVPNDDQLLVEVKISPSDIGMIKKGDKAVIKVTAYDFTIYGGLDASVIDVSADSFTDPNSGNVFFKAKLKSTRNYIESGKRKLFISAGMTGSVDIIVGRKTILNKLMKPITRAFEGSMKRV